MRTLRERNRLLRRNQRGALLLLAAFLIVILLGFSAFAVDLGRLYVLQTEMQNAADAAARAGAMELDGTTGARQRATLVATERLVHEARFARTRDLLGADGVALRFYSWIGSIHDPEVGDPVGYCVQNLGGQWIPEAYRCESSNDATARYIEVRLEGEEDAYTVDFLFLPALSTLGLEVQDFGRTRARAVAGRNFFLCNYPPVMMCNPFESVGENFRRAVDPDRTGGPLLQIGDSVSLVQQGNSWSPGNFGFLTPTGQTGSSRVVGSYLADPSQQGCTPPVVHTATGSMQSHPIWAWNTRFDYFEQGGFRARDYPPAPNVMEYPMDQTFRSLPQMDDRFGNGDWMRDAYWQAFHSYHADIQGKPPGYDTMTRWEVYQWEIREGFPPCDPNGPDGRPGTSDDIACLDPATQLPLRLTAGSTVQYADPWSPPRRLQRTVRYQNPSSDPVVRALNVNPMVEGLPTREHLRFTGSPASVPERRLLYTAIVDCAAQDISGKSTGVADSMAIFFMLQAAPQGNSPDDFVAEYLGLASEEDNEMSIEVVLYE